MATEPPVPERTIRMRRRDLAALTPQSQPLRAIPERRPTSQSVKQPPPVPAHQQPRPILRPPAVKPMRDLGRKDFRQLDVRQVLGFLGALMLIIGVFSPVLSAPIIGAITYIKDGGGDGVLILAFALMALVLTAQGQFRGLYFPAALSLAVMAFTFFQTRNLMDNLRRDSGAQASYTSGLVQFQWGWGVLLVGVLLLVVAAQMRPDPVEVGI
jgi:hypothetical protein